MLKTDPKLVPNDFGKLHASREAIKHLENSLKNLESGRAPTPSFKLYGDSSIKVVEDWLKFITGKHLVPDFVVNYEVSRLKKFGPQGGYPKWQEVLPLFLLYKENPKQAMPAKHKIIEEMKARYGKLHCQMLGVQPALDHLKATDKIEDRAAGDPTFNLKKTDPTAQRVAVQYAKSGKWKGLSGYTFEKWQKQKPRIFMPMPFASMIKQAQYFVPFLGAIQQDLLSKGTNSPFVAWADKIGFKNCFGLLEKEIKDFKVGRNGKLVWYKTDFEKMDTHNASSQFKEYFLPCLEAAFGFKSVDMTECMLYTTTAPIISPSGTMTGDHGTASGAEVTNASECCGNDYYQLSTIDNLTNLCTSKSIKFDVITRRLNGDDGIIVFWLYDVSRYDEFAQLILQAAEEAATETGYTIQREKQEVSLEMTTYCQHMLWWDENTDTLKWGYPTTLSLNSILNPMKEYSPKDWDKDYRDIDVIEKVDGVYPHPWFDYYVDWVAKGTKYPLLGSSEQETARILSKYDKYRSLQTLGERYNRQDYHISESPAVKRLLASR